MTEFTVLAAQVPVGVRAIFDSTRRYCQEFLTELAPEYSVEITQEDLLAERTLAAREDALEGLPVRELPLPQLEITAVLRKITEKLFSRNILLFHGSAVAVDGKAYLFTAKSGTGKSTHTRLWREYLGKRAVMVNDDKPFLKIGQGEVTVYGSPWSGKHRLGSPVAVKLKGLCILERSKENRIERIPPEQAVKMLIQQSSRPREPGAMPQYLEMIDGIAKAVRFYRLGCNMELQAAKIAYEMMAEE